MEASNNEKRVDGFLKTNPSCNESEENIESITVKEEVVSDLEPECLLSVEENVKIDIQNQSDSHELTYNCQEQCDDMKKSVISSWQGSSQNIKNQNELSNEGSEVINNQRAICPHDKENFKIVKRKVRCGDCRLIVCPECCKALNSSLQNHFSGSDKNNLSVYSCKRCHLVFSSSCSLQAHIRLHSMLTPYVCPDCGMIYNNIYFLVKHLMNKCQHVYKVLRYKCKICTGTCFTSDMFVKHIHMHHIEFVFRCLFCSIMFRNSDEFDHHMESNHSKQKVQNLNYFRCSLCSNMVFPRYMYEKHITQHRNSPDSYEMEYQCPCGYVYTLLSAFRDHIEDCSKKGILPTNWSFLENKIEPQDVLQMEKIQKKDNVFVHELKNCSNAGATSTVKKLSLINVSGKNMKNEGDKIQNIELLVGNKVILKSNLKDTRNTSLSLPVKKIADEEKSFMSENDIKQSKEVPVTTSEKSPNNSSLSKKVESSETQNPNSANECSNKTDDSEPGNSKVKVNEITNVQLEKENPEKSTTDLVVLNKERNDQNPENGQVDTFSKEIKQIGTDSPKMFYDHIPCDHLGYVKTQNKNESEACLIPSLVVLDKKSLPKDFHMVTELDEKTGIILTKQVPIGNMVEERNKEEEMIEEIDNTNSINVEQKMCINDKNKLKPNNSFFTCPFCVVVFPKQGSTFQQFKLHVESYHPDAALNVVVDSHDNNSEITKVSNNSEFQVNSRICRFNSPYQNKSTSVKGKDKEIALENVDKEYSFENSQGEFDIHVVGESQIVNEREKGLKNETNKLFTSIDENKEKSICWSVELSIQSNGTREVEKQSDILEESKVTSDQIESKKCHLNSVSLTANETISKPLQALKPKTYSKKLPSISKDNTKENIKLNNLKRTQEESDNVSNVVNKCEGDIFIFTDDDEKKKLEGGSVFISRKEGKLETKQRTVHSPEVEDIKISRLSSDFENDCETSKDSNWSATLDIKDLVKESKVEEKEKSAREGEVWTELYESLMVAEKLKKNKKKNFSPDSDEKKKSVTPDYSAKRVVKKPKRYRESSDSNDSEARNENSDSDGDFVNSFQSGEYKTDKSVREDLFYKKQKLLDKLQNADDSFLDYLSDLINKKEKFELYKKHSTLRASHYSQDLRCYRNKVLNGIKLRGKHQKFLRYQELLKKKNSPQTGDNKDVILNEINNQRLQKNSKLVIDCNKSSERKRGRPRKICDLAKVKERRRSDKEVDFIEKNFERKENDFSPSKRKRKLSSKLQYYKKINLAEEKDDFASGQVISNKYADSSKKLNCAVCKEVFPEVTEFREHVLTHRMEENSYQCMECGECFVVRPSLEKHLHAFHKIKNTEKYITENECCSIKKEFPETENEPLKENQCKVCKDQFERAIDLTKHFRIHGMAFLKEFKKESKHK